MNATRPVPATRSGKLRFFVENALIAAVVSAVITVGGVGWLDSRLENSKEHVAAIARQKDQFETSHGDVFAQLGLYTGKVFDKGQIQGSERDRLQAAITKTQIEVAKLKAELPKSDADSIDDYSNELDSLSKNLRNVKRPEDLGPVYVSAQHLLELHDKLSERIRPRLDVSIF